MKQLSISLENWLKLFTVQCPSFCHWIVKDIWWIWGSSAIWTHLFWLAN